MLALRARVSRSRLGEVSGLGVLEGEIIRSMCQISTLGGQRTEIFLAILRFVTFCDITLSPHTPRLEQVEACGISTCRNSALSGTVPEISANVTFRDIFCYHAWSSRFALETGRGLRPRHNMGHGSSYLRAKIQLSERYCLRDISKSGHLNIKNGLRACACFFGLHISH